MSAIITELRTDHANFLKLLGLLEAQFSGVEDKQGHADYLLMHDIMVYMTHYPDHFHHPKEDLVFARLAKRDGALRPLLDSLAEEHRVLARKGKAFLDILQNVTDGELVRRDAIETLGKEYVDSQRSHIDTEEHEVFRPADELLSEQDWAEIDDAMEHMDDPLFGPILKDDFRMLYEHIRQES